MLMLDITKLGCQTLKILNKIYRFKLLNKAPSKNEVDKLLKYYKSNNYTKTKEYALFLTKQFPDHDLAWRILSIVFEKTGKISESLTAIKKILNINPKDPLAHYNLTPNYPLRDAIHHFFNDSPTTGIVVLNLDEKDLDEDPNLDF